MPITDAAAIKEHTQLTDAASQKVDKFAPLAEERLRQLITDPTYDEIKDDDQHDDHDTLKRAESFMSLYFGFQFLNLRPTEMGGFIKVIGYAEDNKMMMSARELKSYQAETYQMAIQMLDGIRDVIPEDPDEFDDVDPEIYDAGAFKIG